VPLATAYTLLSGVLADLSSPEQDERAAASEAFHHPRQLDLLLLERVLDGLRRL
jgi:hypothetical protein